MMRQLMAIPKEESADCFLNKRWNKDARYQWEYFWVNWGVIALDKLFFSLILNDWIERAKKKEGMW